MSADVGQEHLQRLAKLVNERIEELGPKARQKATPAQLLAVVALGLAEDLDVSEQRRRSFQERAREVSIAAIERIDRRLEADASGSPPEPE